MVQCRKGPLRAPLGHYLRSRSRGDFKIITTVGRTLYRPQDRASLDRAPWAGGLNFEADFDYTYDGVVRAYEVMENAASLEATIPAAFWSNLKGRKLIDPDAPVPAGR